MNILVFVPGIATLLFTVFEMPKRVKKQFFRVPVWVSSSAIALIVGVVAKGVMGPMSGFVTEIILFPGLHLAKKHYDWSEKRVNRKSKGGVSDGLGSCNRSETGTRRFKSV